MKLHEIPRGSRIKVETSNENGKLGDRIIFHRTDGMYSYCTVKDTEHVCHLHVLQELEKKEDEEGEYYELAAE
jgi:hypothetical protein